MADIEYNNPNFTFSFSKSNSEEKEVTIPSGQSGTLNEIFSGSFFNVEPTSNIIQIETAWASYHEGYGWFGSFSNVTSGQTVKFKQGIQY
tara:strand:- start:432 stop:701 length:270 start_codon:yes stop_codon:yes gene_type:complete